MNHSKSKSRIWILPILSPDTIVAASRTQVIEATNIALRLSGRDGADPQVRSLNDFFGTGLPPRFTDPKIYYDWWPGVAINARGDVVVVFQRGREGGYFGTGYAGKRANDPGFGSTRRLERGRCPLDNWNGSVNRTGDYVGAQADPADDRSFWIAGEFPTEIQDTCSWHTGVARVR